MIIVSVLKKSNSSLFHFSNAASYIKQSNHSFSGKESSTWFSMYPPQTRVLPRWATDTWPGGEEIYLQSSCHSCKNIFQAKINVKLESSYSCPSDQHINPSFFRSCLHSWQDVSLKYRRIPPAKSALKELKIIASNCAFYSSQSRIIHQKTTTILIIEESDLPCDSRSPPHFRPLDPPTSPSPNTRFWNKSKQFVK